MRVGEKIKQVPAKAKELIGKLNKTGKIILAAVLVIALAVVVGLVIYRNSRPYTVLFTELSSEDMTSVLTYLEQNSVRDYRVENNDTILVRENQEASLKARIMMQGFPTSGYGYRTYLDNVGTLSSESDRQILQLYELQDRMSASIRCLDGVKDAIVTISQGEDNRFILSDDVIEAEASVIVTMQNGQSLSEQMATVIRSLVSHAMQGLHIDNVVITDTSGKSFVKDETATSVDASQLKLNLEAEYNANVRNSVLAVLQPLFGSENVSVSVRSDVDVSHIYKDSIIYEEPEWAADGSTDGKGIIGRESWGNSLVRGEGDTAGGVVGTTTNADLNEYVVNETQPNGDEREITTSGERDYDVSQHNIQSETVGGTLNDLTVAVAINSSAAEVPNIEALRELVAKAAGIATNVQAEKIAIVAYPFYNDTSADGYGPGSGGGIGGPGEGLPRWILYAAIAGSVLFLILLMVLLLLGNRRKKQRLLEEQLQREEEERLNQQLAMEALRLQAEEEAKASEEGADIMDVHTERSMELRKSVRQFVEENPSIAAQMVKNWLRGGEENG